MTMTRKLLLLACPLENLRRYIITSTPTDLKSLRLKEHKSERHLWVVSNWIFLDSAYTDVQFSSSPSDAPRRIRSQYTLQIGWQKSLRWLKAESESTPNSMGAVAYRAKVPTGGGWSEMSLFTSAEFFLVIYPNILLLYEFLLQKHPFIAEQFLFLPSPLEVPPGRVEPSAPHPCVRHCMGVASQRFGEFKSSRRELHWIWPYFPAILGFYNSKSFIWGFKPLNPRK